MTKSTPYRSIVYQLILYIFLFSSLMTLVITLVQLYLDYSKDIQSIENHMSQIKETSLEPLTNSLWNLDKKHLQTQLEGLIQLKDMHYLAISANEQIYLSIGTIQTENVISRSFPMIYQREKEQLVIGQLEVIASLAGVYQRLWDKVTILLISNAIKTFLVSSFIFIIFQFLVTRHLSKIAQDLKTISPHQFDTELILNRQSRNDELEQVVVSVNEMKSNLQKTIISKDYFDTIINSMSESLVVTDYVGKIKIANQETLDLLGYSYTEILGKPIWVLFEKGKKIFDQVVPDLEEGSSSVSEINFLTKQGKKIPMLHSCSMMEGREGKNKEVICMAQNITNIKNAENEQKALEHKIQKKHKSESLGVLAGGIAHDFNNLLGMISLSTEMLKAKLPQNMEWDVLVDAIQKAENRAESLVRQILTFSRMEVTQLKPINIAPVVQEALQLIRATIPANIIIKQYIQEECGNIMADVSQIHQIIINLTTNAAHAMEEKGGELVVSLERMHKSSLQKNEFIDSEFLQLIVRDTGHGIAVENIDNAFDPFFTTKQIGKGTGLGLSVVQGIVSHHKGTIALESSKSGTTIEMLFPIVKAKEPLIEYPVEKEELYEGRGHLLVVEDEVDLAQLYKLFLEEKGFQVTICSDGDDALNFFLKNSDKIDLVITDQAMPHLTGKQLCEELLKIRPNLPIILNTGYSSVISHEEAKAMGISAFLMKPVDLSTLIKMINEYLNEEVVA